MKEETNNRTVEKEVEAYKILLKLCDDLKIKKENLPFVLKAIYELTN